MVICGYLFDAVGVNIFYPGAAEGVTPSFGVNLDFGAIRLALTQSRLNLTEIPPGKTIEFEGDTEEMRALLQENPMVVALRNNGELVGKT